MAHARSKSHSDSVGLSASDEAVAGAPPSNRYVSGADQAGVRLYNERLVLSLVRRFGQLSKMEVARITGLSVQSCSTIMNRLQADGLLRREAPLRGRVGQPTVPASLDPEGAFSLGLKIGRRSCDLVLIDFCGAIRRRAKDTFPYPTPDAVLEFVKTALPTVTSNLTPAQSRRIAGLGVASPFQLWSWSSEIGAPEGALEGWRDVSIADEVSRICPYPVTLCNDATSACAAEFFFGEAWRERDFLYFFIGAFVGGGLVLDGALYTGRTGNAAALGSMPIAGRNGSGVSQLIALASIYQLERRVEAAGLDPSSIWRDPFEWDDYGAVLERWIGDASYAIAQASVAAASVIDVSAVVIDGAMPTSVREKMRLEVAAQLELMDRRGLSDLKALSGVIGADARAIGGAALPLIQNFARDREVLFKDTPSGLG
ncbi:MAG: ROK family transcriptional regulator [Roseiarcus sp.]